MTGVDRWRMEETEEGVQRLHYSIGDRVADPVVQPDLQFGGAACVSDHCRLSVGASRDANGVVDTHIRANDKSEGTEPDDQFAAVTQYQAVDTERYAAKRVDQILCDGHEYRCGG